FHLKINNFWTNHFFFNIIKNLYHFNVLKCKFRQDLPDYLDFCVFPEERHKPNRPANRSLSIRRKRIEVAQGLPEPGQKTSTSC
ncbi:MAG: hypothetical protein C0407_16320, partial [Desulfobacca sp.]|nr:hypothetical protein [Desulfobacca sp.]